MRRLNTLTVMGDVETEKRVRRLGEGEGGCEGIMVYDISGACIAMAP